MTKPAIRLRVTVADVWDTVTLDVAPETTVDEVKRTALRRALGVAGEPSAYEVKFRGALILDQHARLADLAVPNGAPMIVLAAQRRPVR